MKFEWDSDKAAANDAKHGVPFDYATRVFHDGEMVVANVTRPEDGEDRMKAIGVIEGRLFTVVHTMRGDVCRVISARRANGSEEKAYNNA